MTKMDELKAKIRSIASVCSQGCMGKCKEFNDTLNEIIKEAGKEFGEL